MPSLEVLIHTDGGSRGNPGPSAIGAVIWDMRHTVLAEISETLGVQTNNVAEYTAVLRALEHAAQLGATNVHLRSDSLLLIQQLRGKFKVKNPTLKILHAQVRSAAKAFEEIDYEHVRREYNSDADALVNQALDAAGDVAWEAPPIARQGDLFE